jgi:hypothetical protein
MNLNYQLSKDISSNKYPNMDYENYVLLVEEGFEILKNSEGTINSQSTLKELKSIRMALEYRIGSLSYFRKNQISKALGSRSVEYSH